MRIIAGQYGGRRIHPPTKMPHTRPTTDLAKEGLFNMLQSRVTIEGASTLELFAGTGAVSYELASRGASDMTIVEKDIQMSKFIKQNLELLGVEQAQVLKMDAFQFIQSCTNQYDIIFADPPYALTTIEILPTIIIERNLIAKDGYFILEHTSRNNFEKIPGYDFSRNYGATIFSFFKHV